jgi:propanol-preferring alcohol dehydrogenase
LCPNQKNSGYSVNGSFAEYMVAPAAYVGRLPANVSFGEIAPVMCAGVTTYKGLKETEVRPGEWVVIVGAGGLGHMGIQYARAMGMHVAAVDVADDKLALAAEMGAEITINSAVEDPFAAIQKKIGGAHGALVTAVAQKPFQQAVGMLRRGGTCALVGLPPCDMALPIFDIVLQGLTVRGSIVGTRMDLKEALQFAAEGKIHTHYETRPLDDINDIFDKLRHGHIKGRIVLQIGQP